MTTAGKRAIHNTLETSTARVLYEGLNSTKKVSKLPHPCRCDEQASPGAYRLFRIEDDDEPPRKTRCFKIKAKPIRDVESCKSHVRRDVMLNSFVHRMSDGMKCRVIDAQPGVTITDFDASIVNCEMRRQPIQRGAVSVMRRRNGAPANARYSWTWRRKDKCGSLTLDTPVGRFHLSLPLPSPSPLFLSASSPVIVLSCFSIAMFAVFLSING